MSCIDCAYRESIPQNKSSSKVFLSVRFKLLLEFELKSKLSIHNDGNQ